MPDRIRRRRPVGWNQLLAKGHVHKASVSKARHQERQSLEDEAQAYMDERSGRGAPRPDPFVPVY